MDHNDVRHMLSEYIDGTLTPGEKASVEDHLKTCQDCSKALAELKKTVEDVRKIEEIEPPTWMTQKIMAALRAEEEKKPGLFHRLFYPLHIKLPLETVGVMILAVAVYFVFQNAQETKQPFPGSPQTSPGEQEQADKGALQDDQAALSSGSLQRQKEVPQEPEYKALDMKPAYEQPKPPVPAPAPEPMSRADEQRGLLYESDRERSAEQTVKRMQEQTPAREKRAATAPAERSIKQVLTLAVPDLDQAAEGVEHAAREHGGKIIRKQRDRSGLALSVVIDDTGRNSFIDRLNSLGELKDREDRDNRYDRSVIEIRIVRQVQQN